MLDQITKRKIDAARQILVGKVPDPKSQIEQITLALIYKFMNDTDKISLEIGGKASYFVGDYATFSWDNIIDTRLTGQERMNRYTEGLERMARNPNIPELFRNIFKNAFLPFRDPNTLNMFLEEIDAFEYDNSERLGDAYEYLLSIMSSQGDAGQFRTPRHIIDFIVSVVNPTKNDRILDPACGTAGFLISAIKHIAACNTDDFEGDLLSLDDKQKIADSVVGYDISPDMVRISLVNMFLHNISQPHIYEYDTLTSTDKWDESFSCILANPPFMSPKGGIQPHNKFSIPSNRSEVLFIDYIMDHLSTQGKAGVIVPEGIIFQSQNAYRDLRRKMVDENFLWAVVSLPSGVFNPYSGVKTSILFFDREVAMHTEKILFVNIESDGFDLGARRDAIESNDIPEAAEALEYFKKHFDLTLKIIQNRRIFYANKKKIKDNDYSLKGDTYSDSMFEDFAKVLAEPFQNVPRIDKKTIDLTNIFKALSLDLTPVIKGFQEQYNQFQRSINALINDNITAYANGVQEYLKSWKTDGLVALLDQIEKSDHKKWGLVKLSEIAEIVSGGTPSSSEPAFWDGGIPWVTLVDLPPQDNISIIEKTSRSITELGLQKSSARLLPINSILVSSRATIGRIGINKTQLATNQGFKNLIIKDENIITPMYLALFMRAYKDQLIILGTGGTYKEVSKTSFEQIPIPLPSIEIQQDIVNEYEVYQRIIEGAKTIIRNWTPMIKIDTKWDVTRLWKVATFNPSKNEISNIHSDSLVSFLPMADIEPYSFYIKPSETRVLNQVNQGFTYFANNDLLVAKITPCFENGKMGIANNLHNGIGFGSTEFHVIRTNDDILPEYVYSMLCDSRFRDILYPKMTGSAGQKRVPIEAIANYIIPLPPINEQRVLVDAIKKEYMFVKECRKMIELYQSKIQTLFADIRSE